MNQTAAETDWVEEVFFPHASARTREVMARGGRFAYYTTAETAFNILRSRQVWLRNAMLMNDFSEIGHGMQCLRAALDGEAGAAFTTALETCFPDLRAEVEQMFTEYVPRIQLDTYLACVSEHLPSEDRRGRLSMWRAYGGSTGVALVVNGQALFGNSQATSVFSSPVLYADPAEFVTEFSRVATRIRENAERLRALGREAVRAMVFHMLRFAVLGVKHPGFAEEFEWRIIASPSITGRKRLESELVVLNGVPQEVLKLPLENAPEEGLVGMDIPSLVERIIVGPCAFPHVTSLAFIELLGTLGVSDPVARVVVADMPLRHDA